MLHVSVFLVDGDIWNDSRGKASPVIVSQNKELHAAAAPAVVAPWIQAERRHEGVP